MTRTHNNLTAPGARHHAHGTTQPNPSGNAPDGPRQIGVGQKMAEATKRRRRPVREYSQEFTMTERRRQLAIDVPAALHRSVRAKAKRQGVSVRALVLEYLQKWADDDNN